MILGLFLGAWGCCGFLAGGLIDSAILTEDTKDEEGELRRETRLRPYTRHDASTLTLGTAPQQKPRDKNVENQRHYREYIDSLMAGVCMT